MIDIRFDAILAKKVTFFEKSIGDYLFGSLTKLMNQAELFEKVNTVDPLYSEQVGTAKCVHLHRVFTINVFNLTIN
jgi:hypothetical protein